MFYIWSVGERGGPSMKYGLAANIKQSEQGRGRNVNRTKSERYSETAEWEGAD